VTLVDGVPYSDDLRKSLVTTVRSQVLSLDSLLTVTVMGFLEDVFSKTANDLIGNVTLSCNFYVFSMTIDVIFSHVDWCVCCS
jgi:hypothetical protein